MTASTLHHVWQYTDVDRKFWSEHLDQWLPQRIYDAHTHIIEPRFRMRSMSDDMRRQYWVNEVSEPIGAADAARCHQTVFPGRNFSCLAFGYPSLEFDIEENNQNLEAECACRGWQRLAVVLPQWSAERVERELDLPCTKGVKVYYSLIGDDPTTRDKYLEASIYDFLPRHQLEVLNERRSWVTLHVPKADRLTHPDNLREIREIRRKYPQVKLVIAHLGRNYTMPHATQSLPCLADDEGLFFDISAVFNPAVLQCAMKLIGPSRLIYGTDNPIFYMRGRQRWRESSYVNHTNYPFHFNRSREPPEIEAEYTLYIYEALRAIKQASESLGLNREEIEAIFHGNAEKLLESIPSSGTRLDQHSS